MLGVPSSLLRKQRQAAAAAAAPGSGTGGQDLDIALMLAGGSAAGRAGPAYDAHTGPIGAWAKAVWEKWIPRKFLGVLAATAKRELAIPARPWASVTGPGKGFVLTASRLSWVVQDAFHITTDTGKQLQLDVDPPVVIVRECRAAVRRWRWRAIEDRHHSLHSKGVGAGAEMAPIWRLHRSKEETDNWNSTLRGVLKSAIAGRQWSQQRCHQAGCVEHNKCLFCLYGVARCERACKPPAGEQNPNDTQQQLSASAMEGNPSKPKPTAEQVEKAPVGTLRHRIWACKTQKEERMECAPLTMRLQANAMSTHVGDAAFDRALFPSLALIVLPPAEHDTFAWLLRPEGGTFKGRVYSDGSRLDGPSDLLARNGWAFVVIDEVGETIAAAQGIPPRWIEDIPGTEAWAVLQAASRAEPGCTYRVDCEPCVNAIHRGKVWATAGSRVHARVNALMLAALDDTPPDAVVWMPAHTGEKDVGKARLGDNSLLTAVDRRSNGQADEWAKEAAMKHRVPENIRKKVKEHEDLITKTAMWVAKATYGANHNIDEPRRDTEATTSRAGLTQGRRKTERKKVRPEARPSALGGHSLVRSSVGWQCKVCKTRSSAWAKLAPKRCAGPVATTWAVKSEQLARESTLYGGGH